MCSKVGYASERLASNAIELHKMINPDCGGINAYQCADCNVMHIGHINRRVGKKCRETTLITRPKLARATRDRIVKSYPYRDPNKRYF